MLVARDLLGRDKVVFTEPELDAEDFALLSQKAPGGYFFLGERKPFSIDRFLAHQLPQRILEHRQLFEDIVFGPDPGFRLR